MFTDAVPAASPKPASFECRGFFITLNLAPLNLLLKLFHFKPFNSEGIITLKDEQNNGNIGQG